MDRVIIIDEQSMIYENEVEVADLNEDNLLKPSGYLRMINRMLGIHLTAVGVDVEATMQHNLAWALVSITFEVEQALRGGMHLSGTTWHSAKIGPYFRREFMFRDDAGGICIRGSSFSVLLDVEKRTVFRKRELPFPLMPPGGEVLIEASPTLRTKAEYVDRETRTVRNSQIDCLGHVNNARYAEFAYDVFTEETKQSYGEFDRFEFYFAKELRLGDSFIVSVAEADEPLAIRCRNADNGEVSFDAIFAHAQKKNKIE